MKNLHKQRQKTPDAVVKLIFRDELPQNGEDMMKVSSDVYTSNTRGRKFQTDAAFSGRSMIEMLGVLAIIGVLSVGAIAGYSKAMFKYKLNKQADQYTQVLNGMIMYKSLFKEVKLGESLIPYYKQLNIIPKEMSKPNDLTTIYDIFSLPILIHKGLGSPVVYFDIRFNDFQDTNHEICRNIFQISQNYSSDLYALGIKSTTSEDINHETWLWGDDQTFCQVDKLCLRDLKLDKIERMCNYCDKHSCGLYLIFPH